MIRDRYKNYFYVTIFASLAITVLYCAWVSFWLPHSTDSCWLDDCFVEKETLAREIGDRPKIVFGGGSGTLFGVRAKDVQTAFGVPAVNMSLHAGLELDYMLYRLKRVLRKGDVVILPLEYEHFLYGGGNNALKTSFVVFCDREYLLELSWRSRAEYIFSVIGFNKVFKVLRRRHSPRSAQTIGHCPSKLNENGDGIANVGEAPSFQSLSFLPLQQSGFTETRGLALIREFNRWCKARGVRCYITYANSVYLEDYGDETYRRYFENLQNYFVKNDIAFIGTPYDFFFPLKLFWDTQYHLNQEGVTLRTHQLIEMMRKINAVPRTSGLDSSSSIEHSGQ